MEDPTAPSGNISVASLTRALQSLTLPADVSVSTALLQAARADKLSFSGNDTDAQSFDMFLFHYTTLCNTYNSSPVARKMVLPNLLRNAAFSFYVGLPDKVQNDYDALCAALGEKFDSKEYAQRCLDRLSTLRQDNESVAAFAQRVRSLGRAALPKLTGPVFDTLLTQYLRAGLNAYLREKMEDQPPSLSFDDAVAMATRFQYNQMRRQNPDGMLNSTPVSQMAYGLRAVAQNRPFPPMSRPMGRFTKGPPMPSTRTARSFNEYRDDRPPGRWEQKSAQTAQPSAERSPPVSANTWCRLCRSRPCHCAASVSQSANAIVCYNCQAVGHYSRDCRAPRNPANSGNSRPSARTVAGVQKVAMPSASVTAELNALRRDKAELSAQNLRLMKSIREQMVPQ